jgi:hypothetical protein
MNWAWVGSNKDTTVPMAESGGYTDTSSGAPSDRVRTIIAALPIGLTASHQPELEHYPPVRKPPVQKLPELPASEPQDFRWAPSQ